MTSAPLVWDDSGKRLYETGVSKCVLYPLNSTTGLYDTGVAWNGITEVDEKPSGAASTKQYADNIPYLNLVSAETFDCTIKAYTYPVEFGACDGTAAPKTGVTVGQQARQTFGLCYRTEVGNDADSDLGYKLHVVYGCLAAPSEKDYASVNDSPAAVSFSWDVSTSPAAVTGYKPTSLLILDSTLVSSTDMAAVETVLYGSVSAAANLPLPDALLALITGA